jgi:hypothetical protein
MPHPIGRLAGEGFPARRPESFDLNLKTASYPEPETKPDLPRAMERILAWFQGQVIDRPPIRFSAHNAEYDAATATDRHWPTPKDRWFDAECQPAQVSVRKAWVAAASLFLFTGALAAQTGQRVAESSSRCSITTDADSVQITAGILNRTISLRDRNVTTTQLAIDGQDCLAGPARELAFRISFAQPNQQPKGVKLEQTAAVETTAHFSDGSDTLVVKNAAGQEKSGVQWVGDVRVVANSWVDHFQQPNCHTTPSKAGSQRVVISGRARPESPLTGLKVDVCYEVYEGFPVIRKWVDISNNGTRWLKLNNLVIDDFDLSSGCRHQTPLTPSERGAGSSVISLGTEDGARGLIAVSEIPSALRQTRETGAMGYSDELFEWVLGPGERFVSEPVFLFGYSGEVRKTVSAVSTPLDRTLESVYLRFLRKHVGVAADSGPIEAPQWCSWSNFGTDINDANIRQQAAIAARCGFALILLDQGWQRYLISTQPDPEKFPDFESTSRYIHSLNVKLGLWVTCYRPQDSAEMRAMPEARSGPLILRDGGFGMSFASPWRKFYAQDLAGVSQKYGVSYFKQDFTNIRFGDMAEGHESRTRNESLLRGLRGLLEAQDLLRKAAPQVTSQISHEIYWGTPGAPCDVAVLKHAAAYHIPPNDYSGVGERKERVSKDWTHDPAELRRELVGGCFNARRRLYAHRGLPLYALAYYAAHAVNFHGSLTPAVQERQVCSWLMGVPSVFAGDLASLTEENINCYRRLFSLLQRLEKSYDLYRHFQFSGVPAPTDEGWHWWGKLNENGGGAVVVLRGSKGEDERAVNIPWLSAGQPYQVSALLLEKDLGRFTGKQLQSGALSLKLPPLGQEILELKPILN